MVKPQVRAVYDKCNMPSVKGETVDVYDSEEFDESYHSHENRQLFSSVDIDAFVFGQPYEQVKIQYSGDLPPLPNYLC